MSEFLKSSLIFCDVAGPAHNIELMEFNSGAKCLQVLVIPQSLLAPWNSSSFHKSR